MIFAWANLAGGAEPGATSGWQALARLKTDEALREFRAEAEKPASDAAKRDAEFGRGVSLLAKQPMTTEQVEEAWTIFNGLADSGTDEVAQGARYFLGRIAQHHREQPNLAEAAKQFRRLLSEQESSIWAQTALSRLVLLELYPERSAASPGQCVATARKLLAQARLPVAQSELHLVIADAIFYYRLPVGEALPDLLAAEKLRQLDAPTRADVLVQIAEVSALTGDPAQARKFYETFLAEFPLDQRQYMVKQKLAGLK
ncbi:MAG: hypothetical protein JWM32_1810 [Verrucomicrobia bacterium]|nr:hypothetical protein [Verrucomicrobiota bacterium]